MRKCTKCNKNKRLSSFSKRKDSRDGFRTHCIQCVKRNKKAYHLKNKEVHNNDSKTYYYKNKEKLAPQYAEHRSLNRENNAVYARAYYRKNRQKILARKSIYIQKNLSKIIAKNMKRHAEKLKSTPKWLSSVQLKQIEAFYIQAAKLTKETNIKHHVDHIIPLKGISVRGLHVPWNLQILTAFENISKGNKVLP